jgi:hypothetical protein
VGVPDGEGQLGGSQEEDSEGKAVQIDGFKTRVESTSGFSA